MTIQLKVIAVSSNHNSFGLRNMIFISNNGQGWQAAANDLNLKKKDTVLTVPEGQDIPTFLTLQSFEIPQQLESPSAAVMEQVWGKPADVITTFTLDQIRHAELVTFPEDFEKAWLQHFNRPVPFVKWKGLFWFIAEYGSNADYLELATKIVAATVKPSVIVP